MHLGVSLAYWPWFEYDEQQALATLADQLGFHSVWVAEGYGQDGVAALAALSVVTEHIGLGAGIFQIPARQPTATAAAAATIDRLSGGRMLLGLGLSGPQVSEGFYGVPFTSPLRRTREYVEIVRQTLGGAAVEYAGREWTIPVRQGGLGLGKPLRLLGAPVQEHLPIYLGVGGEQLVEQAGRIADGWLPFLYSPEHAHLLTAPLYRGLAAEGRPRTDVVVAPTVPAAIDDDLAAARNHVRPILAFYLGAMGSREKNFYVDLATRYGHGESARACQEEFLAGNRHAAGEQLTDELIDLMSLAVTPSTLDKRLAAFESADVDVLVVTPFGDRTRLLHELAPFLPGTAT
jgi:F420-dependent oxidoreductase-like protein